MGWRNGQAYSQDLRDRVVALLEEGSGAYEVAETLQVSASYVYRVRDRLALGERTACAKGGGRLSPLRAHEDVIAERMRAAPDTTIMELRVWLLETHGVSAGYGPVWSALHRLGLTHKKSRSTRPSRAVRTSSAPARRGARASTSHRRAA